MTTPTVFDIETEGLEPQVQLTTFEPEFSADARLKDPIKIQADIEEKKSAWLEKAALHAERSRVLVIGYNCGGTITFQQGDEAAMLADFWKRFDGNQGLFIGHNIKGFDVPYLMRRSYILGVKPSLEVMEGRYLSRRFIDTMEVWGAGEWGSKISLDNLARSLGVGSKSGSGADFAKLYHADQKTAIDYLRNDLLLTEGVAKKMGLIL